MKKEKRDQPEVRAGHMKRSATQVSFHVRPAFARWMWTGWGTACQGLLTCMSAHSNWSRFGIAKTLPAKQAHDEGVF